MTQAFWISVGSMGFISYTLLLVMLGHRWGYKERAKEEKIVSTKPKVENQRTTIDDGRLTKCLCHADTLCVKPCRYVRF